MEVLETEAVEDLFRFAVLLTGKRGEACAIVSEALGQAESRATQFRAHRSRWIWTARWVWDRLRKRVASDLSGGDLAAELVPFFEPLAAKERAALALRSIHHLEVAEIAQILNLRPRELRKLLARLFEERQAVGLDEMILRDGVAAVRPSAEEYAGLLVPSKVVVRVERSGGLERVMGGIAVVFGVLFIVGFTGWERWRNSDKTLVREQVGRLLEFNENSNLAEFEPFDLNSGRVVDWLYLHGMESVQIPKPLSNLKPIAGRVANWKGTELAQLVSEAPKVVLLIIDTSILAGLGAKLTEDQMSGSGWSTRWVVSGKYAMLLAVPGGVSELEAVFAELSK